MHEQKSSFFPGCSSECHPAGGRRELTCRRLDALAPWFSYVKPHGAYYLMARYQRFELDSVNFALRLLYEARVITIPGGAFGPAGEGRVRLSAGAAMPALEKPAMDAGPGIVYFFT